MSCDAMGFVIYFHPSADQSPRRAARRRYAQSAMYSHTDCGNRRPPEPGNLDTPATRPSGRREDGRLCAVYRGGAAVAPQSGRDHPPARRTPGSLANPSTPPQTPAPQRPLQPPGAARTRRYPARCHITAPQHPIRHIHQIIPPAGPAPAQRAMCIHQPQTQRASGSSLLRHNPRYHTRTAPDTPQTGIMPI